MVLLAQSGGAEFCIFRKLRKNTTQLPTYGQTQLSWEIKWTSQGTNGSLVPKGANVLQAHAYLGPALSNSSHHLSKGVHQAHKAALVLQCQRHNIRMYFHHGSVFATCIYLPKSSQSVLQFSSNHCRL